MVFLRVCCAHGLRQSAANNIRQKTKTETSCASRHPCSGCRSNCRRCHKHNNMCKTNTLPLKRIRSENKSSYAEVCLLVVVRVGMIARLCVFTAGQCVLGSGYQQCHCVCWCALSGELCLETYVTSLTAATTTPNDLRLCAKQTRRR